MVLTKPLSPELEQEARAVFENMPSPLFCRLKFFAEGLGLPLWQVIHNLLIDQWARRAAEAKVRGGYNPRPLFEFQSRGCPSNLLTGELLFRNLVQQYESELKRMQTR